MPYIRPQPKLKLTVPERQRLLQVYYQEYRELAQQDPSALNRKVPREALAALLNEIGGLVLRGAAALAADTGTIRRFLDENPLPPSLRDRLPDDFRVFCLILNALKQ